MAQLLKKPDGPVSAFWRGALAAFAAVIVPLGYMVLFQARSPDVPRNIAIAAAILVAICFVAGLAFALWALAEAWAYREVTSKDDPW